MSSICAPQMMKYTVMVATKTTRQETVTATVWRGGVFGRRTNVMPPMRTSTPAPKSSRKGVRRSG